MCDEIDEPARSIAGDYADLYAALFGAAARGLGVEIEFDTVDARTDRLPDVAACDGWVIGGSRHSVGDDLPWLHRLDAWVRAALEARVHLVGICFGHQLVAHCAGGAVARAACGWTIGAVDYRVRSAATAAPPTTGHFRLVASHQDQVIAAPPSAEVFASTPTCPIAGYTIGDRVTCVQGHPEFPTTLAAALYRDRAATLGPDAVEAAIATLDDPTDDALIARWIVDRVRASPNRCVTLSRAAPVAADAARARFLAAAFESSLGRRALVAQGIEHRPPEPCAQVRILPRALSEIRSDQAKCPGQGIGVSQATDRGNPRLTASFRQDWEERGRR